MTTFRHRWLPYLASSAAFAVVAAGAFQVDAAVTACETTTLANANFEATAGGKAAARQSRWHCVLPHSGMLPACQSLPHQDAPGAS